ncbi:MAG: RsmD family RNA methyltransferase [Chitinispirillaceae bacterium]
MKLRIKSGTLGRRVITVKSSRVSFRPTLERVRQSVVDSIGQHIPGALAADFCAGSGAFGFELISRGAKMVHFVEKDRNLVRCIREHLHIFSVQDNARVISQDLRQYIKNTSTSYDILFFDPPYFDSSLNALVNNLMRLVNPDGILLYQHDRGIAFEVAENAAITVSCRRYGRTVVEYVKHSA